MAKKKIDLTDSIGKSNKNILDAGKGAALTQDLGALFENTEDIAKNENEVPIKLIRDNPFQPRIEIKNEQLIELAESIKQDGMIQPIIIQKFNDEYIVIAGHRRVAAHKLLGKEKIWAHIIEAEFTDTQENNSLLFTTAAIENLQRENLHPLEIALSCREAIDKKVFQSVTEISKALNKPKSYLSKIMSVLKLQNVIVEDLLKNKSVKDLEVLYELQKIHNSKQQIELFNDYKNKVITREDIRNAVKAQTKTNTIKSPIEYKINDKTLKLSIDLRKFKKSVAEELQKKIEKLLINYK